MTSPVIVTGISSFGMSGRVFHAPFVQSHPGFRLKAVVERRTKSVHEIYPDVLSYNNFEELLEDPEISLVIVNTPNNLHYEQAKAALLAGKHVLVEKPVTVSLDELNELYAIAEREERYLMAYQNRRWDGDFQSVKSVVESGRLGNLVEAHFRFDRYKAEIGAKQFKEIAVTPGSGLTYDLGPHLLDQAISLFGKPIKSTKVTGIFRQGSSVPDYFNYQLSYPGQLKVFITGSLLAAHPTPGFVLHGTSGSYIKSRENVQEIQLLKNMQLDDPAYGKGSDTKTGLLTTVAANGQLTTESVVPPVENYQGLFTAVYDQLINGIAYPITKEQIKSQIVLLEMPVTL